MASGVPDAFFVPPHGQVHFSLVSPLIIFASVAGYFAALLGVAWWTGRRADAGGYFLGNRASPWWAVALGLIGDSLSGVSYISVPGAVGVGRWYYLQVVLGYVIGYVIIIHLLLPMYYRLNLTSIYGYLGIRFDRAAQRTGAAFFILSRLLGAAARLYLAVNVFQVFVLNPFGVPFAVTSVMIIGLILLYTVRGGIKTLVWTDLFQSAFLVLGVVLSAGLIARQLGLGPVSLVQMIASSPLSEVFDGRWRETTFWAKQLLAGAAIALVMTGLDQNTMQKNLSCRSLRDAQKNLYTFTAVMVAVSVAILSLGVLLQEYATRQGIPLPERSDDLFPMLAFRHLGPWAGLVFIIGLTAATFNSADAVLTTLTTSFCLDCLGWDAEPVGDSAARLRQDSWRQRIHLGFAVLLLLVLLLIGRLATGPVINLVLKLAGYTGGPLLALFGLGLFTRVQLRGLAIPAVCLGSAGFCAGLEFWMNGRPQGYRFGFELLLLNALITAGGLWAVSVIQSVARGDQGGTGTKASHAA